MMLNFEEKMSIPQVSIVIPTKNGGDSIEACLSAIFGQKTRHTYEVIAIDSGSSDDTLEIVKRFPVRLIEIKSEEFGHGKTRNLGGKLARGNILVFTVQDAVPANKFWLERLVENLDDSKVAGAYSRWLPKEGCSPSEARWITRSFRPIKEIRNLDGIADENCPPYGAAEIVFFSNVSSSIRKRVWSEIPFDEEATWAEDREWARKALEAGYSIVYEPRSMVYHSNNDPLGRYFRRRFDIAVNYEQSGLTISLFSTIVAVFADISRDFYFILNSQPGLVQKLRWLPYVVVRHLSSAIATQLGLHHRYIPKKVKKRLSMLPHLYR